MPTLAKNEGRQLETGVRNISTSSVYAQPWWRGFESNCVPSPGEALNGSVTPGDAPSQGNSEGGTKDGEISADPHSGMDHSFLYLNAAHLYLLYNPSDKEVC